MRCASCVRGVSKWSSPKGNHPSALTHQWAHTWSVGTSRARASRRRMAARAFAIASESRRAPWMMAEGQPPKRPVPSNTPAEVVTLTMTSLGARSSEAAIAAARALAAAFARSTSSAWSTTYGTRTWQRTATSGRVDRRRARRVRPSRLRRAERARVQREDHGSPRSAARP